MRIARRRVCAAEPERCLQPARSRSNRRCDDRASTSNHRRGVARHLRRRRCCAVQRWTGRRPGGPPVGGAGVGDLDNARRCHGGGPGAGRRSRRAGRRGPAAHAAAVAEGLVWSGLLRSALVCPRRVWSGRGAEDAASARRGCCCCCCCCCTRAVRSTARCGLRAPGDVLGCMIAGRGAPRGLSTLCFGASFRHVFCVLCSAPLPLLMRRVRLAWTRCRGFPADPPGSVSHAVFALVGMGRSCALFAGATTPPRDPRARHCTVTAWASWEAREASAGFASAGMAEAGSPPPPGSEWARPA